MKLIPRRRRDELSSWSPLNQLGRLREEVNRLFESPLGEWTRGSEFFGEWTPSVDLLDSKDKLTVKAELPGLRNEDIDISLDGNNLTIAGERKHEEKRKEGETYRSEMYYGRFQRTIPLPHAVDPNKITANYKNGLLTVDLPKTEEAKRKQIEVKVS